MKKAGKIAKQAVVGKRKVISYSLAATAPDAFEASSRITTKINFDKTKGSTLVEEESIDYNQRSLPHQDSSRAKRDGHRLLRSQPSYSMVSTSPTRKKKSDQTLNDWNPEPMQGHPDSRVPTVLASDTILQDKIISTDNFNELVALVLQDGVRTSVGSGHCLPVPQMPSRIADVIQQLVPAKHFFGISPTLMTAYIEELSMAEHAYCRAIAEASILSDIKDPELASTVGISRKRLLDSSMYDSWTNKEYSLKEWRVFRKTGISSVAVLRLYRAIESTLCTPYEIMLRLQFLWLDDTLSMPWWESMSHLDRCPYSKLLLTDVNLPRFRLRLPLTLSEFSTHIERQSDDVREGLIEYWLNTAGEMLNAFISDLEPQRLQLSPPASPTGGQELTGILKTTIGETGDDSGDEDIFGEDDDEFIAPEFKRFRADKKEQQNLEKSMKSRMAIEGLDASPKKKGEQGDGKGPARSRADRVLDCAAVLMSKQLRGMCENSLHAFVSLFESLKNPVVSPYAVFVINVRVRKITKKEVCTEFSEPVEVCLVPDCDEFKSVLSENIRQIILASRDYPRAENSSGIDNKAGNKSAPQRKFKKLNDASVSLTDAIVQETTMRVKKAVEEFYKQPEELLEKFSSLEALFTGSLAETVSKAIAEAQENDDAIDAIECLSNIVAVLEQTIECIKSVIPDSISFPLFEVRYSDLKETLIKYSRSLLNQIMESVLDKNRQHMLQISSQYQEIANTLVAEVVDSSELRALQDFTQKAAGTLSDLYDQYVTSCFERTKFLLENKFKMSREDIQIVYATFNWPSNIQSYLRRSYENQAARKRELEELLEEDQHKLENDLNDISKRVELIAENASPADFRKNVDRIHAIKRDLEKQQERAEEIFERESLLDMPHSDQSSRVDDIKANLEPLDRLWNTVKSFIEKKHYWSDSPLGEIDPEEAQRTAEDYGRALLKVYKDFDRTGERRNAAKRIAETMNGEVKDFINETIPLMLLICNPGMKSRHWDDIERITGIAIPKGTTLTVSTMMEVGLQHHVKDIEDICISANKEYGLQLAMDKMEKEWADIAFETKSYRTTGTRILCGTDEIQQLLDDQIVKTQAMRGSRFIKPFIERITKWEQTLIAMQDILDNWLKVQATWLYLEPIFSSDDIMRQMPTEGKMFRAVDNTWRESMSQTVEEPGCIAVAQRPGFLDNLIEANNKLELIQKGLNDYLETKRLAFPRFFFLSNDELLEILAETKDPLRVQPHLKKCFDGIAKLQFQPNLDITACFDPKGEKLDFPYERINHKKINPNDSGGNVEKWLIEVELVMRKSLAYTIDFSMKDFLESDRIEWLQRWQGQVVICINQTRWCADVEKVLVDSVSGGLQVYYEHLCRELMRTVELVRGDIPKALRTAVGALVVMDVHNRDTIHEMVSGNVEKKTDFDWLAQMRYYWQADGVSAMSGKPGSIQCMMINAMALYAYEYIGNQERLVITPLTDRCYRTLMGAIHLNLGGAPEGPAGTGKTETVKDLAKAIAIQCVVTNCSDGLDYLAMAKFFKGLASSGAWACFDEFNRIQLEVLSVVAQQIMQIQLGKMKGLERFVFEGTELELRPTCCPFITMNPGYAGRAELPDNLKVLFRTVAMMVPDYAMISEIILYSYGYTTAKPLAVKIVTTYKLCSEQLSSQAHYDYGMRAVIAVLRAAGNLKRSDGHLQEDVLVLRSIIDVNLPKFLSPDVPLFSGITSDLFPGVTIDPPDRDNMKEAFLDACLERSLIPEPYFWDKIVQVYDMMVVRHGFMIVGNPYAGKSSCWKVLKDVLGILHERFPDDKRWSKVLPIVQNPKSVTMGQLYGMFDLVSHEWTDGVLAINFRNAASNKVGNPEDRKWILFDGPVDAIWIENMNTVLDDNKKLCLMSGEIIAMSDVMSMMFEPMDLLVASPATVSRCGMVYLEPEQLGWGPLLESWLESNKMGGKFVHDNADSTEVQSLHLSEADSNHIQALSDWLVEPCLCYVRRECSEMSPTVDAALVMSLLNIFEGLLRRSFVKYDSGPKDGEDASSLDAKQLKQKQQDIECCFLFSLIWSIGKSGIESSQHKFSSFLDQIISSIGVIESDYISVWNALILRNWKKPDFFTNQFKGNLILPMPYKTDFYECLYVPEESKWKTWLDTLPDYKIPTGSLYSSILVPNNYTAQYSYMLELLIPMKKHVLMCGTTGTGKSAYVYNTITSSLPQDQFKPLTLGFSAKTSANMTQDIIDGKLDKRRKGVYGPPMGQQTIIFIDDLNMPEVEFYGAQPPIELIRQLIDNGGWYDLKEKSWRSIIETSLVCAMGPPGGGRNFVTPRLLRHFNLFCFPEFDENTLRRIFSTIISWHLTSNTFLPEVRSMTDMIVEATLDTYTAAMATLLPTPAKSHYTFNLRDYSRVIQGVLLSRPSDQFNKGAMVRMWTHEALRVFGDRLIDDRDREWFHSHLEKMCINKFSLGFYEVFKHLDVENSKVISLGTLRSLYFGDYTGKDDGQVKPYVEVQDFTELQPKMEEFLADFNQSSRKPMDLVMFGFAIEHVSRISRILKLPGGNALLVGVGGSGRQSLTRLSAHMAGYSLFQIEISKNYTNVEWREDLKTILRGAGTGSSPMTFLFSDTQIKNETFVEDINNILNSGEVPNIFPADERAAIAEAVRPFAKLIYGKASADMSIQELYAFFVTRVRANLHIVLAFSPIGDAFRDRLRKFPALINCCTIDWFTAWPEDALLAVAQRFLAPVSFSSDSIRESIVTICQKMDLNVRDLSDEFLTKLKRKNYVTPTSYLELIIAFKTNLDLKRLETQQSRKRYEVGLDKLAFAAEQVNKMQGELADLQPELLQSAKDTEALMGQIEEAMPGVEATRATVSAEAAVAQREADIVQAQKDEVEADLAEAIPILEEAIEALNTIKPNDINEIKALSKPPDRIRLVCKAVCIMLDVKAARIPDPADPSKRIMDFWGPSQKMLADSNFLNSLMTYDKDNIPPKIVTEIKRDFMNNEEFDPVKVAKASKAAEGLCRWVGAMITYDRVAKIVAPKKAALLEAEAKLAATMAALDAKKAALQKVEDELQALQDNLNAAKQKKVDLENQASNCDQKIGRANQLLDGLGGERERWGVFADQLGEKFIKLTGDVLISSGVLAYLGPFTAVYRQKQTNSWVQLLKDNNIPCSDVPTLTSTLGDPVRIRQWNIDGLPTDSFSIDNGIVVFNARRWPLMIDPQAQANRWIRNMEKENNLQVKKLTDTNYLRTLENSIQFGSPVLLENVGEELDPSLEPLLQKQLFKQGGVNCIRLGDATVEYSEHFRFYITTKLRNPHYLPEVSVKVTLLNFMITPEGLEDQLLGIVVSQERPDLEEQRNTLILESAENKRLLKEIEDRILHIMSSSSGNILEDETAIQTLKESKILSDEISVKQAIGEETEKDIDNVRKSYSPVAYSSQILFFCIADLANIEPVYQYSLTWFINLFVSSIQNSEPGRDVEKRLENLDAHFTYSLYRNICRSLLEKHKLMFSFLLTSRILGGKGLIDSAEWYYLLTGGSGMENPHPNPAESWLSQKNWDAVVKLSQLEKYKTFKDDFAEHVNEWKEIYDSLSPHECTLPGIFESVEGLGRLCALRCIRADKVVLAIQKFVGNVMGEEFVKPPPFDLQSCYNDSSAVVPLIFILSPGSDPMGAVLRAADVLKTTVDPISLGQGQGPKAERLIERAKQKGTWVVLQNCHLAPSWMTTLEKICEDLDPEDVHSGFRLWCTTYPSDIFPVAVLQNGVKMTNEPPKGLRANLIGSFNMDPIGNDEFYESCGKGFEFRRLIFGLCFFHAVIQERRLYGPLGWNIPYEFNESDLRISVQQLQLFLNENSFVPFKALIYTAGECNYGGRVTDDKDRRTLLCILKKFYCSSFLDKEHDISPSGTYKCPPDGDRQGYIDFADQLPLVAAPEVFGLHENATLTRDQNDTYALLQCVLDTEGGGSGGGGSADGKDDAVTTIAVDILDKLPENFDMEFAQIKYPVVWENSMHTVLCQELIRFNNLLGVCRSSLKNIQKAIKGLIVMSSELEVLSTALFYNRIPSMWKAKSYPSLKPLASYVAELLIRLSFFDDWLQKTPPSVFWISGFFFTQAFLTGAAQNFARRYTIPIDDVVFDFEMKDEEEFSAGPDNGVFTRGLFLEGARWDRTDRELAESLPKVLFSPAPVMHWMPFRRADVPIYPHYKCPVYKTSDRR